MTGVELERLASLLRRWRNLEECLLHEVRMSPDFYRAEILFNCVWDDNGRARERVLEEPVLVSVRLVGIEELRLVGELTAGMKRSPELIDWGLAEIAGVRVSRSGEILGLSVEWESQRRLEARCMTIELIEPSP